VVLGQLKSQPELLSIAVVVLTASAAVLQRGRVLAAGAADYLIKPMSAASLRETVDRILRSKRRH